MIEIIVVLKHNVIVMFRRLLFLTVILSQTLTAFAQDTLVLFNGRIIPVRNPNLQESRISYQKISGEELTEAPDSQAGQDTSASKKKSKVKTMDAERVFSIRYRDGSEQILYSPDSLDPMEFSREEMHFFIKGAQDASKYYKNNLNKGIGFGLGAAAGFLGFYGLAVPPLYATVMGSFTPNLDKKLAKQNEVKTTKTVLDGLALPKIPDTKVNTGIESGDPSAMKVYEADLKKYNNALKEYECALKNHSKNIYFSDTELLKRIEYREGYERKARDRKIRNAMLSGLTGFMLVVVGVSLAY